MIKSLLLLALLCVSSYAQALQCAVVVNVLEGDEFGVYINPQGDTSKRTYQIVRLAGVKAQRIARGETLERSRSALAVLVEGQSVNLQVVGYKASGQPIVRVTLVHTYTFPNLEKVKTYADFTDNMPRDTDIEVVVADLATKLLATGWFERNDSDIGYLYAEEIAAHVAAYNDARTNKRGLFK